MDEQNRNLLLATALSFVVILVWFVLFPPPEPEALPDTAVQESRERVQSAIKNSGFAFPRKHITVNLAPASVRKAGPV